MIVYITSSLTTSLAKMAQLWFAFFLLIPCADAVKNVALNKTATSSSQRPGHSPDLAVDGDNRTRFPNTFHTALNRSYVWWQVDLQTEVQDAEVVIWFRTDFKNRRNGLELYTSLSKITGVNSARWSPTSNVHLCHKITGKIDGTDIRDVYKVLCHGQWRYLMIYTKTVNEKDGPAIDFGEVQVMACPYQQYGKDCENYCDSRHCKGTLTCDYDAGECRDGCESYYSGTDCTECEQGFYGMDCNRYCNDRHCTAQTAEHCTRTDYNCTCQDGYVGQDCMNKCNQETYGRGCLKQCSKRHCEFPDGTCDHVTGICRGGCKPGWSGQDCVQSCEVGVYGNNCSLSCADRHCVSTTSTCNRTTGECPDGCQEHWKGLDCSECEPGLYGKDCDRNCNDRHCTAQTAETCTRIAYTCTCQDGYVGQDCTKECDPGTYGLECLKKCNERHCELPVGTCDHMTGICEGGCEPGWTGQDCAQSCDAGVYGNNCSFSCADRHCVGATSTCNRATGECPDGCQEHWVGQDCSECAEGFYGSHCSHKCGKCYGDVTCDSATGVCPNRCAPGWKANLCAEECSAGTYGRDCASNCSSTCQGPCDKVGGNCISGCMKGYIGDTCQVKTVSVPETCQCSAQIAAAVVGVAVVAVLVVVLFIVALRLRRKRKKRKDVEKRKQNLETNICEEMKMTDSNLHFKKEQVKYGRHVKPGPGLENKGGSGLGLTTEVSVSLGEKEVEEEAMDQSLRPSDLYYNMDEDYKPIGVIPVLDLATVVKEIQSRKGGFLFEFNRLPTGFTAEYKDSQKAENAGKNKYKGYYPYDQSRVKLTKIAGVPGSDYINASFIQSYNNKKTYIAAQATLKKTEEDFWRMIWEHKCNGIVMLTRLTEQLKVKCTQYWPEEKETDIGQFHIRRERTEVRADYIIRHMKLSRNNSEEERTVVQYHYMTWPDHDVPDTLALVNFIWMIRRTHSQDKGPLIVHCSAGIGRTGTYIAVDSLYEQAMDKERLDVPSYVSEMRSQRKNMIQTHEQYKYVFLCLTEMTSYGDTTVSSSEFFNQYSCSGMDMTLADRPIRQLVKKALDEPRGDESRPNRICVNGNTSFTMHLSPSFANNEGYLQAVAPAPTEVELLWELVHQNEVKSVIILSKLKNDVLPSHGKAKKYGKITVTTDSHKSLSNQVTYSSVCVNSKKTEKSVEVYQVTRALTEAAVLSLYTSCKELRDLTTHEFPAVILHSAEDRKSAMSFCIIGNIVGNILQDNQVDIISTVRTYLNCFPDIQLTEENFQLFHDVISKFLHTFDHNQTYQNV